jgi:membrane associated rhomboid family serine protease
METCYRHPDRETGVSCSNCGRSICPDCMTSTSVGMRCPECSKQKTKVRTIGSGSEPTLTYALIAINVIIGLGAFLGGASAAGGGFSGSSLLAEGSVSRFGVDNGDYWRILTAGFLHVNFIHLLFNMFALYVLGGLLEPAIGRLRFGVIYFVSLLAGSFGALLLEPLAPTVGASGAVFGLMGAAVVVMRKRGINPMESGLGLWIGLNLLITFTIPNISIGGHIGGLIGGALAAFVMFDLRDRVRLPELVPMAIAGAIGVAAVVGSVVVSGSTPV